jgi:DNA-binding sugar fermentation-stimulating protein
LAELALIKQESVTRCILCFVIQRSDVDRFQASIVDPEYAEALKNAMSVGVEVIRMVVNWSRDGEATFVRDDLPWACVNPD